MTIPIAKAEAGSAVPRSTWAVWTSAPHRTFFLPGALQLVATSRGLVVAGGFLYLAGWLAGAFALARITFTAEARDPQAISIVALLFAGAIAAGVFLFAIAREDGDVVALVRNAGLWVFLLPVFLVVNHRMIPFFSSRVLSGYAMYRPSFSMPFLVVACLAHYVLEAATLEGWTWIADAPMAAWVGWLAWKLGLTQSFRARCSWG